MSRVACCVDLGSSFIKAGLFREDGLALAISSVAAPPLDRHSGAFDADAFVACALSTMGQCLESVDAPTRDRVIGIALTSQRASVVPVDAEGEACGRALSWQDTAGQAELSRFMAAAGERRFRELTGLIPSVIFTASKAMRLRAGGASAVPLLHDYVLRALGAPEFLVDPSNASVTGLFDVRRGSWSEELLSAADIEASALSRIAPAGHLAGGLSAEAAMVVGLPQGTPLFVGGGDQQCAALGAGVVSSGQAALCLGTAGVLTHCVGSPDDLDHPEGLLITRHVLGDVCNVEGIQNAYGLTLQWACDILSLESEDDLERLAASAESGTGGVVALPYLTGIGSPDYEPRVRGAILGIGPGTDRAKVARALVEGTAFELCRLLERANAARPIRELRVVGGASASRTALRTLAAVSGTDLVKVPAPEATLLGTAAVVFGGAGVAESPEAARLQMSAVPEVEGSVDPLARDLAGAYERYRRSSTMIQEQWPSIEDIPHGGEP